MSEISPPDFKGLGGLPDIEFNWREFGYKEKKRRLVGNPNEPMRIVHHRFEQWLKAVIKRIKDAGGFGVRIMPSAKACRPGCNPTMNARVHQKGRFFYKTDLKSAYPSLDLSQLAELITFLWLYEHERDNFSLKFFAGDLRRNKIREYPEYGHILETLRIFFSGLGAKGIAVGGPASPYLMNLYCEVFLDSPVRYLIDRAEITYSRYVDDLVFSSQNPINSDMRREIRRRIELAHFEVNHQKSRVLALSQGVVSVTKVGLEMVDGSPVARLVYPQEKRRKLHAMIRTYLTEHKDWPEVVSGYIAEFLYYFKNVAVKTATDWKTFALCKDFEEEWKKYGHKKGLWKKLKKIRDQKAVMRARRRDG